MKKFSMIVLAVFISLISHSVFAEEIVMATRGVSDKAIGFKAAVAITAGLAIAIATFGGALGQGRVATAAMEGIARNPESAGKIMTPMIIALALIESLVIYTLVIAFLLQGKI